MLKNKLKESVEKLVGKTLSDLNLACEMIMLDFEGCHIHSQCFTRIIYNNDIILTTLDYQNWDGINNQNNDEWYNLSKHKNLIVNNKVKKSKLTPTNDLLIELENNVQIQLYVSNGLTHFEEEQEQWRYFKISKEDEPHIVIYSTKIE